jgi:hypothetical protein
LKNWQQQLKFSFIAPLVASKNQAINYFTRRDLLEEAVEKIENLWQLPQVKTLLSKQLANGAWKYPGGGRTHLRSAEDYNQIETFRILGELVEKYGMDKRHPAIVRAAKYLFCCQTEEGDFRGIYGTQYTPNYSAAIMELLIKAGYGADSHIEKGFQWLLSVRQNDGGWAIPLRTAAIKFNVGIMKADTLKPNRAKPFSHLVTGVVLRAFAVHDKYGTSREAKVAGELLASRFFKKDVYPDRQSVDFWLKFSYPFWFTDLISSLDSLSMMGFNVANSRIARALGWLIERQQVDGTWKLTLLRNRDKDLSFWLSLAICRVFKRFYG